MLNICYCNGLHLDVVFNAKKSALFAVGKVYDLAIDCLHIGSDMHIFGHTFEISRNVFF